MSPRFLGRCSGISNEILASLLSAVAVPCTAGFVAGSSSCSSCEPVSGEGCSGARTASWHPVVAAGAATRATPGSAGITATVVTATSFAGLPVRPAGTGTLEFAPAGCTSADIGYLTVSGRPEAQIVVRSPSEKEGVGAYTFVVVEGPLLIVDGGGDVLEPTSSSKSCMNGVPGNENEGGDRIGESSDNKGVIRRGLGMGSLSVDISTVEGLSQS